MTETIEPAASEATAAGGPKKRGGLGGMLIADLKSMAAGLGIAGAGGMKKAQLIEAIKLIYASTYFQNPKAFSRRVGHRIEELERIRDGLRTLVRACPGHGRAEACPILNALNAEDA